jgi:hypothetical protein
MLIVCQISVKLKTKETLVKSLGRIRNYLESRTPDPAIQKSRIAKSDKL